MKICQLVSTFCAILFTAVPLFAEIKLPAIFGSNMVLQQQTDVTIWGTAEKNATVEVITSWADKTYSTKAADDGRWKLKITTPKAGGSYNVTISDGKALTLENVLIGEVWVCSGQSNMQMPMKGYNNQPVLGSIDAVLESTNANLRLFNVGMNASITPREDFKRKWDMANPETTHGLGAREVILDGFLVEITEGVLPNMESTPSVFSKKTSRPTRVRNYCFTNLACAKPIFKT